jgi:cytochrome c oxidase subunit 3
MSAHTPGSTYFVPQPSRHPLTAAIGLLCMFFSLAAWLNGEKLAPIGFAIGLVWLLYVLWQWFGDAIAESQSGAYGKLVDSSFRWSMSWFIFSEVMFFGAFFGALFYAREFALDMLNNVNTQVIWPDFAATWPNIGPGNLVSHFRSMTPWPVPTINTALLLSSGATLTVSHHALRENHRRKACTWLAITIALGVAFLFCQGFEYFHAYNVTMGGLMLSVVLVRMLRGDFTADHHFAFEGAAWYWHFVDVVWLGLYIVVYWL